MKRWFNEEVNWRKKIRNDEYNKPVLDNPIIIKGKVESINKMIKGPQGQEIIATIQFYTKINELKVGDFIDDYEIVDIKEIKDFRARPKFLEVLAKCKILNHNS